MKLTLSLNRLRDLKITELFKGVVYCFFSLHDCVYGVQYDMLYSEHSINK